MSKSASGGYDFDFIDTPSEDLQCSICLSVLRQPQLTSCCGNHFCQPCVIRILEEGSPCPLCQEKEFTTFLNKSISRKINELKIHCPNSGQGCKWTGQLKDVDNHLLSTDGCDFVEVECELCRTKVSRCNLSQHKEERCPERPFACEYCGLNDSWIHIVKQHLPVCNKFPLSCPNNCDIGTVERKDMDKHLNENCPLQIVPCQFDYIGCQAQLPRKEIGQHDAESTVVHLSLMSSNLKQLLSERDKKIAELEATVKEQGNKLSQLELANTIPVRSSLGERVPPLDIYMEYLHHHWDIEDQWFSEPFYTHYGGYKMCLSVFAYGIGKGHTSHISVFANIMKGENDDDLDWPFLGDIEVSLITDNETYEHTFSFTSRSPPKASRRVTEGIRNIYGQGAVKFIKYNDVRDLNTLHFCVTSIDVHS